MLPTLFKLGPFVLHTYGLLVALGFLSAYTVARARFSRVGLSGSFVDNLTMAAMIGGLLGARLLFFIVDPNTHFLADPLAFFRVWEGGLVFYGGFLGAGVSLWVLSRVKEISFRVIADGLSVPLLLGQAIGRLGCFAAGCCYGRPTSSFFGVVFVRPDSLAPLGVRLQPTQLFESAGNLALMGLVWMLERRKLNRGDSAAAYMIGYGTFRFLIEFLRGDDRGPFSGGLSPSQVISVVSVIAGIALIIYDHTRQEV